MNEQDKTTVSLIKEAHGPVAGSSVAALLDIIDRLDKQLTEIVEAEKPLLAIIEDVKEYEDIDDVEITYTDKSGESCIVALTPEYFHCLAQKLKKVNNNDFDEKIQAEAEALYELLDTIKHLEETPISRIHYSIMPVFRAAKKLRAEMAKTWLEVKHGQ